MYKVQTDVPVLAPERLPPARRKYPFEDMAVGDMFFVPDRTKNTLSTHTSTVGRQLGRKFATRLTWMKWNRTEKKWQPAAAGAKNAVQGIGVWRLK